MGAPVDAEEAILNRERMSSIDVLLRPHILRAWPRVAIIHEETDVRTPRRRTRKITYTLTDKHRAVRSDIAIYTSLKSTVNFIARSGRRHRQRRGHNAASRPGLLQGPVDDPVKVVPHVVGLLQLAHDLVEAGMRDNERERDALRQTRVSSNPRKRCIHAE